MKNKHFDDASRQKMIAELSEKIRRNDENPHLGGFAYASRRMYYEIGCGLNGIVPHPTAVPEIKEMLLHV